MTERLEILITAKDEASKVVDDLGNNLKGSFKVGLMAGTAGLALLAGGFGIAMDEAMDAEANIKKLEAVIKSTGGVAGITSDEAQDMANSFMKLTGINDDVILSTETMLLTFTEIGEDVFPAATEAALNMGEMFGGSEAAAIQLGKALNNPVEGISALTRVGVTFTDAQKEQIEAMVEAGDVAGAQKIILAELEREFGGVARAAGTTLAGRLRILTYTLLNGAEAVGTYLIPVFTKLLDENIIPLANGIGEFVDKFLTGINLIITAVEKYGLESLMAETTVKMLFGQELGDQIYDIALKVSGLANTFTDFVENTLMPFVSDHAEGFKAALIAIGAVLAGAAVLGGILTLGGAIAALANPLTAIVIAAGLLAMAWTEDWGGIRSFIVNDVWPVLEPILSSIEDWLKTRIPEAVSSLKDAFDTGGLELVAEKILNAIGVGFARIGTWIALNIVYPAVQSLLEADWSLVVNAGVHLLESLGEAFADLLTWVGEHIVWPLVQYVFDLMTDPMTIVKLTMAGLAILDGMKQGLGSIFTWASDNIVKPISTWVTTTGVPGLLTAAGSLGQAILDGLVGALSELGGILADIINNAIPDKVTLDLPGVLGGPQSINIPNPIPRKRGGNVYAGELYAVGEDGMEYYRPGRSGTVVPNGRTGGNVYNLNIHTNAPYEDIVSDFRMLQSWAGGR